MNIQQMIQSIGTQLNGLKSLTSPCTSTAPGTNTSNSNLYTSSTYTSNGSPCIGTSTPTPYYNSTTPYYSNTLDYTTEYAKSEPENKIRNISIKVVDNGFVVTLKGCFSEPKKVAIFDHKELIEAIDSNLALCEYEENFIKNL